jgi:protein-S-isoprenylcysteine O-methyltransferase Ste14
MTATPHTKLTIYGYNTIAKQVLAPPLLAIMMFALADTTDWFWGWVFNIVHTLVWVGMTVALLRENPELLNARGDSRKPGTKLWDYVILGIYGIAWIVTLVLGALDVRYGWTGPLSPLVYITGNVLMVVGFALTTWSMVVNRNFEPTVRIQAERGHNIVTAGPYQYVRHPGYVGVIIAFYLGMPLALGSWPTIIPAIIGLVTMVIRTTLEDQTLQRELSGYVEYTQETRYRLLPGVW